jgi:hypothetical protein
MTDIDSSDVIRELLRNLKPFLASLFRTPDSHSSVATSSSEPRQVRMGTATPEFRVSPAGSDV